MLWMDSLVILQVLDNQFIQKMYVIKLTKLYILCPSQLYLCNIKRPTTEYYFSTKLDYS